MKLPPVVKAYFEADRGEDADAFARIFSRNAVVTDEGRTYEGIEAIRAWWLDAKEKYHHVAQPLEMTETGDLISVRAQVHGQFPSSPARLEFVFTLENDKIVALEIV
ncbi:nuclear transport factor 2 family protein [Telmatospirillum sp. J64-1]|uniref:nuclear transport factor 2 family protein n=1 Tax=Telmatospirillum sp. J64-1 TaxID=2502183 RepID=UPI00115EC1AE|nr:nuclear transport factor 2 family protein [Telmatospirillum sp. J64-1]